MDLYCRHKDRVHPYGYLPHQFSGHTEDFCKRQARKRGWVFHRDGKVSCPICVGAKRDPVTNDTAGLSAIVAYERNAVK